MADATTRVNPAAIDVALITPRLRVEPLRGVHARLLFDGLQHPAIYEWISATAPSDIDRLEASWAGAAERTSRGGDVFYGGWAVQRLSDGAWIGKLDAEVQAHGVATNVGYLFLPPFWGHGYASEAVRALSDHLTRHGVIEQRATVTLGNEASERVLERAGFVRSRVIPGNDVVRGVTVDDVEYIRREGP